MFSMSRSTKKFPQLKMCDNCVKSYSSWNAFFDSLLLVTQMIKGKQLYYKMWSRKSYILRIIDIGFSTAILIKGGTLAQFFFGEGVCNDQGYICYFLYRSYKVLLTDVVSIPRWAIQAPGSLWLSLYCLSFFDYGVWLPLLVSSNYL